jgi:dTDP-4-dehydrorhamnose reductase
VNRPFVVLIAGRSGQLAIELQRAVSSAGHRPVAIGRPSLDLTSPSSLQAAIAGVKPDAVVNASAYTAVDKAEDEAELAAAINAAGAGALAAAAANAGVPIVHVSTDYVFDGTKDGVYLETDPPAPLGVYGRTKLEGEQRVAEANPRHVILRTSWVFSAHGHNFVKTMLRLARERTTVSVVDDQRGCPTSAGDLARAITTLLPRIVSDSASADTFGVFHAAGKGPVTWYAFARAIMDGAARRGAASAAVVPISTADYPTRARRPENSILDSSKLGRVHDIDMPPWQAGLDAVLDELLIDASRTAGQRP